MIQRNKLMIKSNFLKSILIISLVAITILPVYTSLFLYPSFKKLLTENTEEEAVRVGTYLGSMLLTGESELKRGSISANIADELKELTKGSSLVKIKVFSPSGEIIFSTDHKDIGKINKKSYFQKIVAKGNTYTKVVKKDTKSLEDQIITSDVIETYVPVMNNEKFVGAFEIYYDTATRKEKLDKLVIGSSAIVFTVALSLLAAVILCSIRVNRATIERNRAEEKLRQHHNKLEELVQERTKELQQEITERKGAEQMIQLQLKRLNVLHSIDRAITASLDLRVTLDILLDQVTTQLNIDAATILLLNQQTHILEYVVSKGFRTNALKYTRLRLGESNAGRAAIERRIVIIPDLKEEIDGFVRSELFTNEDFITYFAVPLIAKGQVKGVLELFHRAPRRFRTRLAGIS